MNYLSLYFETGWNIYGIVERLLNYRFFIKFVSKFIYVEKMTHVIQIFKQFVCLQTRNRQLEMKFWKKWLKKQPRGISGKCIQPSLRKFALHLNFHFIKKVNTRIFRSWVLFLYFFHTSFSTKSFWYYTWNLTKESFKTGFCSMSCDAHYMTTWKYTYWIDGVYQCFY